MSSSCISILCILPVLSLRSKKHLRHILCIYPVLLYLYILIHFLLYLSPFLSIYLSTYLSTTSAQASFFRPSAHICLYWATSQKWCAYVCLYIVMWHIHSEKIGRSTAKGAADCCRTLGKHQSMAEAWWSSLPHLPQLMSAICRSKTMGATSFKSGQI